MTIKKTLVGIIGLLIISIVRLVDHCLPDSISDFLLGFFSGFSFVLVAAYLISFGSDMYKRLAKK